MRQQLVPLLNLKLPLLKQQLRKLLRLLQNSLLLKLIRNVRIVKTEKSKQRWMQQQQNIQDNKKLRKPSLIISLTKATVIEISSMNSIALSVPMHQLPIQAIV